MIKPASLLKYMKEILDGVNLERPPKGIEESGLSKEAIEPKNLNWIFKNIYEWICYVDDVGLESYGKLSFNLPSRPGMRIFVTESETIYDPIVIDQPDTVIEFKPGVTITASNECENIIQIAAKRVTIKYCRLGYREPKEVVEGGNGLAISASSEAVNCMVIGARIFNVLGTRQIDKEIHREGLLVESGNRNYQDFVSNSDSNAFTLWDLSKPWSLWRHNQWGNWRQEILRVGVDGRVTGSAFYVGEKDVINYDGLVHGKYLIDNTVTDPKLASGISGSKLKDNSVHGDKLIHDTVRREKLVNMYSFLRMRRTSSVYIKIKGNLHPIILTVELETNMFTMKVRVEMDCSNPRIKAGGYRGGGEYYFDGLTIADHIPIGKTYEIYTPGRVTAEDPDDVLSLNAIIEVERVNADSMRVKADIDVLPVSFIYLQFQGVAPYDM